MSHPAPETEPVAAPDDPPAPDALALAADFPPVDRDAWRELVAGVLRKAGREDLPDPVEDALRRTVATGVSVAPLYTAADVADLPDPGAPGLPPFVRGSRVVRPAPSAADGQAATSTPAGWDVRQRHADPDVGTTKDAVGADLEHGVTSLWLVLGEGGVPVEALGEVLDGVLLDLAPVTLQGGEAAAEAFLSWAGDRELAPGATWGWTRWVTRPARGSRPTCPVWATGPAGPPATATCARSSWTPPSCTRPGRRRSRSWPARCRPGWPTCGR